MPEMLTSWRYRWHYRIRRTRHLAATPCGLQAATRYSKRASNFVGTPILFIRRSVRPDPVAVEGGRHRLTPTPTRRSRTPSGLLFPNPKPAA